MFFDSKLDFDEQIKGIFDKASKSIGLIRKLRNFLPRLSRQIYKSFVRPYLYYSHIIYDKAFKVSFQNKPESVQYNVALATTWTIRRTCRKSIGNIGKKLLVLEKKFFLQEDWKLAYNPSSF